MTDRVDDKGISKPIGCGDSAGPSDVRAERGFSIAELLTVLLLMGLMITFAGPAMATAYKSYKVRVAADNLTTQLRASRYTAVANRDTRTVTINDEDDVTAPNQYDFINTKGKAVTTLLEPGVAIENSSVSSFVFNSNGSTSATTTESVVISMDVSSSRGDRFTISVTPSGTVSAVLTHYTP